MDKDQPLKLKISVLFNEDRSEKTPWHDEVVDQIAAALTAGGHEVRLLGIYDDLRELVTQLAERKPDLVFNVCETFGDSDEHEMHVTAVLDMLGQRFTGTGPVGMALQNDKALTKKLLYFHDVECPDFAVFAKDELEIGGKMRFPMFVKPLRHDASVGIGESSLVNDYPSLMERIGYIHKELNDSALVEEYIEGREFYVAVLGNNPREVLPLIELDFSELPPGTARIYSREAKFDEDSAEFSGTNAIVAIDLPEETRSSIMMAGLEAVNALQVRDYARVDIRLSADGRPYVVEVNANPYMEQTAAVALAALQAGMGYNTLVNRIVQIAWQRWEQTTPTPEAKSRRTPKSKRRKQTLKARQGGDNQPEKGKEPEKPKATERKEKERA
jgi:D-alanine-D-alanine ligase